jgi:hypothetical protein
MFTGIDMKLPNKITHKIISNYYYFILSHYVILGTAVAQWLRLCVTNRKVAGSIPAGVSGVFIDIKSFRSHYGPGVDSASNRNEYQEYFLGIKTAGA